MGVMNAMPTPRLCSIRKYLLVTLIVLLTLVAVLGVGVLWLIYETAKPHKIADISGPPGSNRQYELWYTKGGDLTFWPTIGNPIIRYSDYYDDLNVAQTQWLSDDRVLVAMVNGTTFDIRVGFDIRYKQTNHDPADMSR